MHVRILPALALFAVTIAAPAKGQAARPRAGDTLSTRASTIQAGTYDLELTLGGGVLKATLVLTSVGDSLDAKIQLGDHGPAIKSIVRSGSRLTISGTGGTAPVVYELRFSGAAVQGTVTYNGESGPVSGTRRQ